MAISVGTQRMLLAHSGGYCGNPGCHADLFRVFESGSIATVDELAHIIGKKGGGPRGDDPTPLSERDEYDNIILLCPTCHTLIDKKPGEFPVEMLRDWKHEHRRRIDGLFRAPKVDSRDKLRALLDTSLRRNFAIFESYGPHSSAAANPLSDAAEMWHRRVVDTILPTNRHIIDLLDRNADLLNHQELSVVERFRMHLEGLEYNHLSGDKNSSVPLFPKELNRMLLDA